MRLDMQRISSQQVAMRLRSENPWWEKATGIPDVMATMTPRPYLDLMYPLLTESTVNRAVVLLGPRRVGKTVMIHHAIQWLLRTSIGPARICYISVDHPLYNELSVDELLEIYSQTAGVDTHNEECFVFLDEIQYMKDWERYLKILVDTHPNIRFLASGSAAAALRLKSTESGAGRFTDFLLPPLTFYEFLLLLSEDQLVSRLQGNKMDKLADRDVQRLNGLFVDYINYGGYPEVILSKEIQKDPSRFIKSDIIDKVLLRDLPSLYGVQDIQELNSLFTTLAFNTANEISLNELSKNSGVAKNTIKKYIEYLEAAFLIRVVHRVDKSAKRFRRKNFFKVYLTNPSIRTALFTPITSDDKFMGSLVETAIFSQWFHSPTAPLYYARWNKGEVDIVSLNRETQDPLWAVEVKWSDRFLDKPSELGNLVAFCHQHNLKRAAVTTVSRSGSKTLDNVKLEFKPASFYCFILGRNILKGRLLKDKAY
ncbi:MAG: ATP-binding protein [Candidatus Zixiibacteriota bacterium]